MDRGKLHNNVLTVALALTLFTFPFRPLLLNNICVVLLLVNWLLQGNFRAKLSILVQSKIALLYVGLYCILIVSYFFSENKSYGGFVLEKNLPILIVPLVLSTSEIKKPQMIMALYSFVGSCFVAIAICLPVAIYQFNLTHQTHYFFYHDLSKPIELHAIYFSFYLAFCTLFLILQLNSKWGNQPWSFRILHLGLILIFCCFIILLSSKTIIIGLILLINLLFLIGMLKKKNGLRSGLTILTINVCIAIAIFRVDYVKERFMDSLNYNIEFIKQDSYSELTVFTGVTVRITFWKFIIEILKENNAWWTGMTVGDASDVLHKKAVDKKLYGGNKERGWTDYTIYNAHNQYFQYLLLLGVVGVVYYMIILISVLIHAIKSNDELLLMATLLFMLFCFTESVLEVNKGIIFFSVIPPLLICGTRMRDSRSEKEVWVE